jgi:hypothetical protein
MKMLLFNYSPELDKRITNLSALPQGGGCTLLECTLAHDGYTLIAKQWRKGEPYSYDALIPFPGNRFYKARKVALPETD